QGHEAGSRRTPDPYALSAGLLAVKHLDRAASGFDLLLGGLGDGMRADSQLDREFARAEHLDGLTLGEKPGRDERVLVDNGARFEALADAADVHDGEGGAETRVAEAALGQ